MLSVVLSVLIRSAIILGAAEALRRFPRLSSAQKHRVLLGGFAMLMLWPLLAACLPEVQLKLWPGIAATDSVSVQQVFSHPGRVVPQELAINWPLTIWICGFLLTLLPLILGYVRVLRLARSAQVLRGGEAYGTRKPRLLIYPGPVMPMTFGFLHPRILLPASFLSWDDSKRRAVLLHEMAHIQRDDFHWQAFASVVTAVFWFQPLCWINRWNLRRESERACDAAVLDAGVRPSDYAALLLNIAQSFNNSPAAAVSMARAGDLEARLSEILHPSKRAGRKITAIALSALLVLTVSASAVTLFPLEGGPTMKRTLLSGLLASAGLSAATIAGSLSDPNGAAIPGAKAVLYNADTAVKQETTTTPEGKFSFESLPAGQYILRIEKPGFAALFREFDVKEESKVDRTLSFNPGPAGPAEAAEISQKENPQAIRVGGMEQQAKLIRKVQPVYPGAAKSAGIQGTVTLELVISAAGDPLDIRVVSSPSDDLSESALEAVRQWRYTPTLLNGTPVDVISEVIVNYTLAP